MKCEWKVVKESRVPLTVVKFDLRHFLPFASAVNNSLGITWILRVPDSRAHENLCGCMARTDRETHPFLSRHAALNVHTATPGASVSRINIRRAFCHD